jgi:hypothetical protein
MCLVVVPKAFLGRITVETSIMSNQSGVVDKASISFKTIRGK